MDLTLNSTAIEVEIPSYLMETRSSICPICSRIFNTITESGILINKCVCGFTKEVNPHIRNLTNTKTNTIQTYDLNWLKYDNIAMSVREPCNKCGRLYKKFIKHNDCVVDKKCICE